MSSLVEIYGNRARLQIRVLALAIALTASAEAPADDGHRRRVDHEIARQALLKGEIKSLEAVLADVRQAFDGQVVGVELERRQGEWIYTVKLLTADGALIKIRVDARTGQATRVKKHD